MAASSETVLDVFSGLGAGLGAGLGFGVLAALLGYSLLPNIILPTRTLVAPTSIYNTQEHGKKAYSELDIRQQETE